MTKRQLISIKNKLNKRFSSDEAHKAIETFFFEACLRLDDKPYCTCEEPFDPRGDGLYCTRSNKNSRKQWIKRTYNNSKVTCMKYVIENGIPIRGW